MGERIITDHCQMNVTIGNKMYLIDDPNSNALRHLGKLSKSTLAAKHWQDLCIYA